MEELTNDDIRSFINNPAWKAIKQGLLADKASHYAMITAEESRAVVVKSKADKMSVIDGILQTENEIIKYLQGNNNANQV